MIQPLLTWLQTAPVHAEGFLKSGASPHPLPLETLSKTVMQCCRGVSNKTPLQQPESRSRQGGPHPPPMPCLQDAYHLGNFSLGDGGAHLTLSISAFSIEGV